MYLSGYYVKDLFYANLMSDSNGKFEFEVPIYEFELIILYYFSLTK